LEAQVEIVIKLIKVIKGFIELLISGLVTAIFIHYLAMGFSDIVWSINSILMWLKQIGVLK
jgi:hypothetical protein